MSNLSGALTDLPDLVVYPVAVVLLTGVAASGGVVAGVGTSGGEAAERLSGAEW